MASASGNLILIHKRISDILRSEGSLTPEQLDEAERLGRLALHMDDVKYRRNHTTAAEAKSVERKSKKKVKK